MHPHAPIPAAKPHLSLNAFSAPSVSREERKGSGERPSIPCALANEVRSGLGELPQPRSERLTSVQWESAVSYPAFARSLLRGLTGALRLGVVLLWLRHPFRVYGSSQNKFVKRAANTPHKLLPGPAKKALLGTWEPGPLRLLVTRARSGNSTQTEITIMYQNKVTLIGFTGNDAEVRTNDNRSFTTLSLATKSSYKKDGKYVSHTEWHRCVVFGKLSEFAGTLKKGAHLQVEGELRSREYETKKVGKKPAQKKTIWEIRVNSILKLDRAEKASPEDQDAADHNAEEAAA